MNHNPRVVCGNPANPGPDGTHKHNSASANTVTIDADDIGGIVTSSHGAEAGVWVIAETIDGGLVAQRTSAKGHYSGR